MLKKLLLSIFACLLAFAMCASCFDGESTSESTSESAPDSDLPIVYVITFETEDGEITKEVLEGEDLTDIPELPTEAGFTFSWSVTDFTNVSDNMTVTLVKTANNYTITYNLEGLEDVEIENLTTQVTYGETFTLEEPTRDCYVFEGWYDADGNKVESGVYNVADNITLTAVWSEDGSWSERA